jgi:hypothetical protein
MNINKFVSNSMVYFIGAMLIILVVEVAYYNVFPDDSLAQELIPVQFDQISSGKIRVVGAEQDFQEIITRPLFVWNREPVPMPGGVADHKASDIESRWQLSGLIVDHDVSYALFEAVDGGQNLRLEPGMYLENWQVDSIEQGQVKLSRDGKVQTIALKKPEPANKRKTRRIRPSKRKASTEKVKTIDFTGGKEESDN